MLREFQPNWLAVSLLLCPTVLIRVSTAAEPAAEAPAEVAEQEPERQPEGKQQTLELADGHLKLQMPATWKQTKPRSRIINHEFSIPPAAEKIAAGRLTIMAASGSIEANIGRWIGQFKTADGRPLPKLKPPTDKQQPDRRLPGQLVAQHKVSGLDVHTVDLRGIFLDRPRGFRGPVVEQDDYRMLGLIIPTPKHGTWFVKFYGPMSTVSKEAKAFAKMVEQIRYEP